MASTSARSRHESIEWVVRCPACGSPLDEGPIAMGDDVRPRTTAAHGHAVALCADCGAAVAIGPDTEWVPRGSSVANDTD